MSLFNGSKGVIGHPMTPFDTYERFEYVSTGPRTPRDICRHLIGQKESFHPYERFKYVPKGFRTSRDICHRLIGQRRS